MLVEKRTVAPSAEESAKLGMSTQFDLPARSG